MVPAGGMPISGSSSSSSSAEGRSNAGFDNSGFVVNFRGAVDNSSGVPTWALIGGAVLVFVLLKRKAK